MEPQGEGQGVDIAFNVDDAAVRSLYQSGDCVFAYFGARRKFDKDTYQFLICQEGREPSDINHASDGFSAVLDIVVGSCCAW